MLVALCVLGMVLGLAAVCGHWHGRQCRQEAALVALLARRLECPIVIVMPEGVDYKVRVGIN